MRYTLLGAIALLAVVCGCSAVESTTGAGGSTGGITIPRTDPTAVMYCVQPAAACDEAHPCCEAVYCDDGLCNPCKHRFCMVESCDILFAADGTPCETDGACLSGSCHH